MESAYLFKTAHTADETQVYYPNYPTTTSPFDQSILSQSNFNQRYPMNLPPKPISQTLLPSPIQYQPQFQQVNIARPVTSQPFSNTITRTLPINTPYPIYQQTLPTVLRASQVKTTADDQVLVYCPVCKRDYRARDADFHAQNHNLLNKYNFTPADTIIQTTQLPLKTNLNMIPITQYPLVQPLQFWTNQLQNSSKDDIYILKQLKNYDGVDRQYFNPPKQPQIVQQQPQIQIHQQISQPQQQQVQPPEVHQQIPPQKPHQPQVIIPPQSTVKLTKPPLQLQSQQTDIYNCFDNLVNGHKGPQFSLQDITTKNSFITPKRQLEDYIIQSKYNKNIQNPNPIPITKQIVENQE